MKLAPKNLPRKKLRLLFDIESNGLLEFGESLATRIFCICVMDMDTKEEYEFVGYDGVLEALELFDKATTLCAHSGIEYDLELLKRLHDWTPHPDTEIIDTLVISRVLNPDRAPVEGIRGPHTVAAWGVRLGRHKPEHEDWTQYSPEMLHRCKEDTRIQYLIYKALQEEAYVTKPDLSFFDPNAYKGSPIVWAKALEMEHKSAKIMRDQASRGCHFDLDKANEYINTLNKVIHDCEKDLLASIPQTPKRKGVEILEPFKMNGHYKKTVLDWYPHLGYCYEDYLEDELVYLHPEIKGPFSRVEWNTINLGSEKQLKEWLYSLGWEPDEWNYKSDEYNPDGSKVKTSPKITESSLNKLSPDLAKKLTLRSKASHKRNQIQGFIDNTRPDGRIEAGANSYGTNTGRMRHRKVANIPKASSDKKTGQLIWFPQEQPVFFGTEMRSLFCAHDYPVWQFIGRDASGLELRMLAHYMNDSEFTDVLLNGDIHTYNQEKAGLATRDQAKVFAYALLYGAGDSKIGEIVLPEGTSSEKTTCGQELKKQFLAGLPALAKLIKQVKKASERGFIKGLDGRKLMMRSFNGSIQKNKALNTLLQGAGAQVMTYARVWLAEEVVKQGYQDLTLKVLDYHDEETYETHQSIIEPMKELMVQSVVQAGIDLKLNIPLAAEAKVGQSWAQVH